MSAPAFRFPIGTQYLTRGKHPLLCTVVDHWTTTNSAGEVVRTRYVSEHEFCGQLVKDQDVVETTVAIGVDLLKQKQDKR